MNNQNDLYFKALSEEMIKREFRQFLAAEGLEATPESAQTFAMRRLKSGHKEVSERELILLLVGELPFAYD